MLIVRRSKQHPTRARHLSAPRTASPDGQMGKQVPIHKGRFSARQKEYHERADQRTHGHVEGKATRSQKAGKKKTKIQRKRTANKSQCIQQRQQKTGQNYRRARRYRCYPVKEKSKHAQSRNKPPAKKPQTLHSTSTPRPGESDKTCS